MHAVSVEQAESKKWVLAIEDRKVELELPVRYRDAEAMLAFFPLPTREALERLPTKRFRPVEIVPGTSLIAVAAFEYRDTDIGPYNELAVCFPILHNPRVALPALPLLLESNYPGMGLYIHHLPVTTEIAWRAGVEIFGYPKFVANIRFEQTEGRRTCQLRESEEHILTLMVDKPRGRRLDRKGFTTYSLREGEILKTVIGTEMKGGRRRFGGATLLLGSHPISAELRSMNISPRAFEVRYAPEMRAVLPAPSERYPLKG
ncbi:MAG: acetoacetate decarboxylase family protein [bacterium]